MIGDDERCLSKENIIHSPEKKNMRALIIKAKVFNWLIGILKALASGEFFCAVTRSQNLVFFSSLFPCFFLCWFFLCTCISKKCSSSSQYVKERNRLHFTLLAYSCHRLRISQIIMEREAQQLLGSGLIDTFSAAAAAEHLFFVDKSQLATVAANRLERFNEVERNVNIKEGNPPMFSSLYRSFTAARLYSSALPHRDASSTFPEFFFFVYIFIRRPVCSPPLFPFENKKRLTGHSSILSSGFVA